MPWQLVTLIAVGIALLAGTDLTFPGKEAAPHFREVIIAVLGPS